MSCVMDALLEKASFCLREGRDYDLETPILFTLVLSRPVLGSRSTHFFSAFPRLDFFTVGLFLFFMRIAYVP